MQILRYPPLDDMLKDVWLLPKDQIKGVPNVALS